MQAQKESLVSLSLIVTTFLKKKGEKMIFSMKVDINIAIKYCTCTADIVF